MIELPIDAAIPEILGALKGPSAVVVAAPGSGKTTRVPPAIVQSGLLSAANPIVLVLEPRRVAARAAAARIADERSWSLGREVGYQVRFDRRFTAQTPLRFLTEGILTRQLLDDPFLESVGAVVLDEFHERSLNGDLALALLREVQREVRPDLRLVVMSATLDAVAVSRFLDDCPVVRAQGRSFEVPIDYQSVSRPTSTETLLPIIEEQLTNPRDSGHVLVFLPGMAEIRRLGTRLAEAAKRADAVVLPLHGSLSADEQDRALAPSSRRKVILATNVAETSLTIDGVTTVIDAGMARVVRYDPERGIDRWELARISRASADQRAGRAGRTAPGRCIRLWSEREHRRLPEFEQPEISRVDLSSTVLSLHAWGAADPGQISWFDPPAAERLAAAERLLFTLGGLAGTPPKITPLGTEMLTLPVHPRLARLVVAARNDGRVRDGATIAALLSEPDIKTHERARGPGAGPNAPVPHGDSDILDRLELFHEAEASRFSPALRARGIDPRAARQVSVVRDDLLGRKRTDSHDRDRTRNPPDDETMLKWLLLSYPDRVVKKRANERAGLMVGGRGVRLGDESVLGDCELFLALEAREDRRSGPLEIRVSLASVVRLGWLEESFPSAVRREQALHYDEDRRRVVCMNRLWYHDLLLREDPLARVDPTLAGEVLASALSGRAAELLGANARTATWLARWQFVTRALPELGLTAFDDDLLAEVFTSICIGKTSLAEVEQTDYVSFMQSRLSHVERRELTESAPESIVVPSGRAVRVNYEPGQPPFLAVRLQELFGWTEAPRIARGRVAVVLHLLGPNYRPVQITSDLRSFWTNTYQQVRKDLRGRYPKHPWPEDPLTAQAPKRDRNRQS
jgi:ATP-dependent helicase HrpB